jgi:peptide deformylase
MKIVHYPHPALRYKSRSLTAIDQKVRTQAAQMLELMYESKGLGLAANQVAWPYQLFVMNASTEPRLPEKQLVCINPVILERKGSVEGEEGCLSFPKLFQKVRRAKTVKVQYYNLDGQLVTLETSELEARVFQHELDHLHGILFIDKMGPLAKLASRGTLKEFEREFRKAQERGEYPSDAEIEKRLKEQVEGNGTPPLL